jgi:glutamate racemase
MKLSLKKVKLELKVNWKISRNESLYKENFILSNGEFESEIAPNIRYNESVDRIEKEFIELVNSNVLKVQSHWCNSFKNAVANLELKVKSSGDLFTYLNITKQNFVITSFSIPMMDIKEVKSYLANNNEFESYKLKLCGLHDLPLLKEVVSNTSKKIRIDANEGFLSLENYLEFEDQIKDMNIEFIEQPFKSSMKDEYKKLKVISKFEIIADESVEEDFDGEEFSQMFHGINVKLMKAGGIENSKYLLDKARSYGLKTMIGCMIETSLGISEAMVLGPLADYVDLDGALLIKNDPYSDILDQKKSKLSFR